MNRTQLNCIVDTAIFVAFAFLVSSGLLMYFVLPSGSGHFASVWGLDRHGWGEVHSWIAFAMLALVAVHLVLHWKWICAVVKGKRQECCRRRIACATGALAVVVALAALPFVTGVERSAETSPRRGQESHGQVERAPADRSGGTAGELTGSMTLRQVEAATGVPAESLAAALGLPASAGLDEPLGRLGRQHGFAMSDVREVVRRHPG